MANPAGGFDLSLTVNGSAEIFPVRVECYVGDLDTRIILHPGPDPVATTDDVLEHIFTAPGTIDGTTYPGLNGVVQEDGERGFWAELTDNEGFVTYAYTSADADSALDGTVIVEDYLPFPNFTLLFDDDCTEITVAVPAATGSGELGTVTYTRQPDGGLPASGGGSVIYTVGELLVKTPQGQMVRETDLPVDGTRGPYTVTYKSSSQEVVKWKGTLHGAASNPPTLQSRIVVEPTLRAAMDLFVTVFAPRKSKERLTLEFRDEDDPSLPIWRLVSDTGSSTIRYVDSATELGPTAWFHTDPDWVDVGDEGLVDGPVEPGQWAQKFDNILLDAGQVRRVSVRAIGEESKVSSGWTLIALPFREVPVIASCDLTVDNQSGKLVLAAVGGKFTRSARFEIADVDTFATVRHTIDLALEEGLRGQTETPTALAPTDRGKRWFGRVTGYNGPLNTQTSPASVSGLGGISVVDSESVGEIVEEGPTAAVEFTAVPSANLTGQMRLFIVPTNRAVSFRYAIGTTRATSSATASAAINFTGATGNELLNLGTIA